MKTSTLGVFEPRFILLFCVLAAGGSLSFAKSANGNGNSGGSSDSTLQIGVAGATEATIYHFASDLNLSDDLVIVGPVVIVVDGDMNTKNHTITVSGTGSLALYLAADLIMTGNSEINNQGIPKNLAIFGTNDTEAGQDISIRGNAEFSATVYAPNADFELKGGASFSGAAVAKSVTMNGTSDIHIDETLMEESINIVSETQNAGVELTSFAISSEFKETLISDQKTVTVSALIDSQF